MFYLDQQAQQANNVAVPDSTIINGQGVYDCSSTTDQACKGNTTYFETTLMQNNIYKIGLVNSGTLLSYTFYIDGHNLTVIETDFVPIKPYKTEVLNVAPGQRYEIVIDANADLSQGTNFWIHAQYCGLAELLDSRVGIIRYDPTNTDQPLGGNASFTTLGCDGPELTDLAPMVEKNVGPNVNPFGSSDYFYTGQGQLNVTWPGTNSSTQGNLWLWEMNKQPLYVNWSDPTAGQITGFTTNASNTRTPAADDPSVPLYLDYADGEWVYFVITDNFTASEVDGLNPSIVNPPSVHPMHLHGHDFAILGQGDGQFDPATVQPQLKNPSRRDTVILPIGGWVWLAFQVGNPGAWVFHCHIGWHASDGFAVQFIEQPSKLKGMMEKARVQDEFMDRCDAWTDFYRNPGPAEGSGLGQQDSGI